MFDAFVAFATLSFFPVVRASLKILRNFKNISGNQRCNFGKCVEKFRENSEKVAGNF